MKRRIGSFTLVAVLAIAFVLLALLWTAPADVAYRVLRPRLGGWQAQGLSGSLWDGRAEQVALHGMALGVLEWKVSRPAFFSGTTLGNASLRGPQVTLDLDFERTGRTAQLRNVALRVPAQVLAPAIAVPGLVPLGDVHATLSEVDLTDGYVTRAVGGLEWREMGVSGAAEGSLGDIEALFGRTPDGFVLLEVRDRNARVSVAGQVVFRGPAFDLEAKLIPREPSLQLFTVLRLVGQRTEDGGTLLRVRGSMPPLY